MKNKKDKIKQELQLMGHDLTMLHGLQQKKGNVPYIVVQDIKGDPALIAMPDMCFFSIITAWIDGVPLLIDKDIAKKWGLMGPPPEELVR